MLISEEGMWPEQYRLSQFQTLFGEEMVIKRAGKGEVESLIWSPKKENITRSGVVIAGQPHLL
jgi:hypothetical protein